MSDCIYIAVAVSAKQNTTVWHAAGTTMLGRNKQEIFNYRSGEGRGRARGVGGEGSRGVAVARGAGGAGLGSESRRCGCGSYSLRDTEIKYK